MVIPDVDLDREENFINIIGKTLVSAKLSLEIIKNRFQLSLIAY